MSDISISSSASNKKRKLNESLNSSMSSSANTSISSLDVCFLKIQNKHINLFLNIDSSYIKNHNMFQLSYILPIRKSKYDSSNSETKFLDLKKEIYKRVKELVENCDYFNSYLKEETYVDDLMLIYTQVIVSYLKSKDLNIEYRREKWFRYNSDEFKIPEEISKGNEDVLKTAKGRVEIMIIGSKDKTSTNWVPLLVIENKCGNKSQLSGLNQTLMTLSCMKRKNKDSFAYGILCNGRQFNLVEYQQNNVEKFSKDNLERSNRFVKISHPIRLMYKDVLSDENTFISNFLIMVETIIEIVERFFD